MRKLIPHLTLSMLLVFLALIILDGYNPAAGYLNSEVSKVFDLILIGLCAVLAVCVICADRRQGEESVSRDPAVDRESGEAQNGRTES